MILKEGRDKAEFLDIVTQLDELTKLDSLVKSGEKIQISCTKENGKLKNWRIKTDNSSLKNGRPFAIGKSYKAFVNELETMDQESMLFDSPDCVVLCYMSAEPARAYDGNVVSHWVELDPGSPYSIKNNTPVFKTREIDLPESDFKSMIQTGLVFYCKSTKVYYPVTNLALKSIGRLFDATMAFNRLDEHLLGAAIFVAEKMSYTKKLRIIHRSRSQNIRPVLAVVGRKYDLFPQKVFFEKCMEQATEIGVFSIRQWSISDELSTLDVIFPEPWKEYYFGLEMQTSDIPQYSLKVTAYVVLNDFRIDLSSNSEIHCGSLGEESIAALFNGLVDEMEKFAKTFESFKTAECNFDTKLLKETHKILGKKRTASLTPVKSGVYPAEELFMEILKTRYLSLKDQQDKKLKRSFLDLFYAMADNLLEKQAYA